MYKPNRTTTSKYTNFTFLPLNLYFQFTKPNNLYFLLTLILLCFPSISPFTPYTYLGAFLLIICTSMVRDYIEDLRRHKQDAETNMKTAYIIKNESEVVKVCVEDVNVNDYVVVVNNGEIPADMVVLNVCNQNKCRKVCYIETSKLDGENNLKTKNLAVNFNKCTCKKKNYKAEDDNDIGSNFECNHLNMELNPENNGFDNYENEISTNDSTNDNNIDTENSGLNSNKPKHNNKTCEIQSISEVSTPTIIFQNCESQPINTIVGKLRSCDILSIKNIEEQETKSLENITECKIITKNKETHFMNCSQKLLKGSILRNTAFIIGYVYSVGASSNNPKIKDLTISQFEKRVNKCLFMIFILYFFVMFFTSIGCSLFLTRDDIEYLYIDMNKAHDALILVGTNYIIFSFLVPISLFITLEIGRIVAGVFIANDPYLMKNRCHSFCRNSNVVEDLGVVEHILMDKTGTLTCNKMKLRYLHINGLNNEQNIGKTEKFRITTEDTKIEENNSINTDESANKIVESKDCKSKNSEINKLKINIQGIYLDKNGLIDTNRWFISSDFDETFEKLRVNYNDDFFLFIVGLLVCNSIERNKNKYEGSSQDEICILKGIKKIGVLVQRNQDDIIIRYGNKHLKINIVATLIFTSQRQHMSIIIKHDNRYILFIKGSDQKLFPMLKSTTDMSYLLKIINKNSLYRTLVVGYKYIDDISAFNTSLDQIDLNDRHEAFENLFKNEEYNISYLGTTFVEDCLQEGVEDCVDSLQKAEIKTWMVTGDKKETAYGCGVMVGLCKKEGRMLFNDQSNMHRNNSNNSPSRLNYINENNTSNNQTNNNKNSFNCGRSNDNVEINNTRNINININYTRRFNRARANITRQTRSNNLNSNISVNSNIKNIDVSSSSSISTNIVNNETIRKYDYFVLSAKDLIIKLEEGVQLPENGIIFRASPDDKGKIARIISKRGVNVLSIGDGNNDVFMLQESNLSVGIRGSEGTQASLTSDFSVPSFVCLKRLLLVHGRYNYMRFSKLTLNSIYKNLLLISIQIFYNFYNGFSGRPVFNFFFLSYFNILFTSMIPFYIAIFDKDHDDRYLMQNPRKYSENAKYFNIKIIIMNIALALIKASVIFWISFFIFNAKDFTNSNGKIGGYTSLNNYFSLLVFFAVFFRQIRLINFYNIFAYFFISLTFIMYFVTIFGIQELSSVTKNSAYHLYGMLVFYVSFMGVAGVTIFMDFLYDTEHNNCL